MAISFLQGKWDLTIEISCGFCAEECPVEAIVLAVQPVPAVAATAG